MASAINDISPRDVAAALSETAEGVHLRIRLTPKAGHDRIDGLYEGGGEPALAARVKSVPEKGKANRALIRLIAKSCGIAPGRVELVRGETSRLKELVIEAPAREVATSLARVAANKKPAKRAS